MYLQKVCYLNPTDIMGRRIKYIAFLFVVLTSVVSAQDSILIRYNKKYSFVNDSLNIISNARALEPFFDKLKKLKNEHNTIVTILHVGDSHIQADFLTGRMRKLFQEEFGNAGRGLVFPYRVAKTNGPTDYFATSSNEWDSRRIVMNDGAIPTGICGISLKINDENAIIHFNMKSDIQDYRFNHFSLFFLKDHNSFNIEVKDTIHNNYKLISAVNDTSTFIVTDSFTNPTNQFMLSAVPDNNEQNQLILFGMNLTNGNQGIIYHMVGVNGADYRSYNLSEYFLKQTAYLNSQLIIVSLGTNEAANLKFSENDFYNQIDFFVRGIKQNNPNALVMLTIPSDNFRKRKYPNTILPRVREMIIKYANVNNLPYWDLYAITGGFKSASKWRMNRLMANDGVHYTKEGYELQGSIFYQAIIKSYNSYVNVRH